MSTPEMRWPLDPVSELPEPSGMGALNWKVRYPDLYRFLIDPYLQDPPQAPVKIAVLDSGVDESHNASWGPSDVDAGYYRATGLPSA